MSPTSARSGGIVIQAVPAVLVLYGLVSFPGLIERWGFSTAGFGVLALWCGVAALGQPLLHRKPGWRLLAGLGAVVVLARLVFALMPAGRMSTGDPNSYLALAKGLLAIHELGINEPYFGGYWRALFPPLYPIILAGWGAIAGFSTVSLLVLGTAIDIGAAILIVRLGARLGNAGAGRMAAWLYLIWPSVLFSAPLAQKEGLCALLIVAIALGWLSRRGNWRDGVAIGVPAALLALTQPGVAPVAGLFGLALIGQTGFRATMAIGLRAAGVGALVMMPWWLRNWLVLGAFVPLTSAGGASLWVGNNPDATGNWVPPPPQLHGLPELLYGKRIAVIAIEWIRANPAAFVRLTITKFFRACGVAEFGIVRLVAMRPPLEPSIAAMLLPLSQATHLAMLGFSALAVRVNRAPGARTLILLIAACGAQLLLFGVWFEFGERHREFVTPFLLLLVCLTIAPRPDDRSVGNAATAP